MRMRKFAVWAMFAGLALASASQTSALAEVLITEAEAKLPDAPNVGMTMRGLTRGPGVEQLSPNPNQGVNSPLPLRIKFQIRNKVEIDPASVKLTYLKAKPVDLTERIKKHLTPDGIAIDKAEVPPGVHMLRLDLKDKQDRVGTLIIKLTVAGK
jgi:hypothetical protein